MSLNKLASLEHLKNTDFKWRKWRHKVVYIQKFKSDFLMNNGAVFDQIFE